MSKLVVLFAVSSLSQIFALEVAGHYNRIEPKLDPVSDEKFFGPPFPADYPHDDKPAVSTGLHFKHPYPDVLNSDKYEADYVKDENNDGGEWKAQMEYDTLRVKFQGVIKETVKTKNVLEEKAGVLDSAKANATLAGEKLKAVQDRASQANKEFEAAQSKDAAASQAVDAGEKAVQEDEQQVETSEEKLEEAKQELSKLESEHNTSVEVAAEANETEVGLEAKANELEAKANEALEAAEAAQKDAKEAKNNATAAEERVEEVANETKAANTTVDKEAVDLEGCEKQLQAAKEKLAKLEQDRNATETNENQTKTVAEAMSETVANVTKTQEALQKELEAAQAEFDAAQEAYDNAVTSENSDEASLNKAAGTLKRFRSGYAEKGEKLHGKAYALGSFTAILVAAFSMLAHIVL